MTVRTVNSDPHAWSTIDAKSFRCVDCGRVRHGKNLPTARYSGGVGYTSRLSLFPGACTTAPATKAGDFDERVLAHLAKATRAMTVAEITRGVRGDGRDAPVRLALRRLKDRGYVYTEAPAAGAYGFSRDGGQKWMANATGRAAAGGRT